VLLNQIADAALQQSPDKTAILCGSRRLTYRRFVAAADHLAADLVRRGCRHGDRVALWLPNCAEALVAYFACFRVGLTERVDPIRASVRKRRVPIAALVITLCAVIFISVAAEQVTELRGVRYGSVGRDLSEQEISQINDLANTAGKPPWLILGFGSMISGVARLTVYLEPNATTERLHRPRRAVRVHAEPGWRGYGVPSGRCTLNARAGVVESRRATQP
jgi:hypothetical protein